VTERVVVTLQVRPDRVAEYRRRHAAVWPEMLRALRAAGWNSYTLDLRPDGLLVGVLETDDFPAAQAAMAATEVNARWQAEMGEFFVELPAGSPDASMVPLERVFDLDAQLAAVDGAAGGEPDVSPGGPGSTRS